MNIIRRGAWLLAAGLLVTACGQKGPLYMEGRVPKSQQKSKHIIDSTPDPAPEVEPSAPN